MKKATGKQAAKKRAAKKSAAEFSDPAVDAVFNAYPKPVKAKLLALRRLIFDTAKTDSGRRRAGGNPEMGTAELSHAGDQERQHDPDRPGEIGRRRYAVYFHCQTDLVETFRELYPTEFNYGGNRSILLDADRDSSETALRHCVALALTYHRNKRKLTKKVFVVLQLASRKPFSSKSRSAYGWGQMRSTRENSVAA